MDHKGDKEVHDRVNLALPTIGMNNICSWFCKAAFRARQAYPHYLRKIALWRQSWPAGKGTFSTYYILATAENNQKRTYFDSGDYALSAAHRVTDNGDIQTGTAHPVRESISHPFAPVPSTGNAAKEANDGICEDKSAITQVPRSPLSRNPSFSDQDL